MAARPISRSSRIPITPTRCGSRRPRRTSSAGLAQRPDLLPQPRRQHLPRRIQHDGRFRRARRCLHGEPARRSGHDRHLSAGGSTSSASTASASTPPSTSIPNSGSSSCRRCWHAREGARHPQFPHLRRSRDGRHGPRAHRREHPRRQASERARLRIHVRRSSTSSRATPGPTNSPSCFAPTRCTRAARRPRCGCRPSSAITTPAGSRC